MGECNASSVFKTMSPEWIEVSQDTYGCNYCLISFAEANKKRITSTKNCIKQWNLVQLQRGASHLVMHVQDHNGEPGVISCGVDEGYKTHYVYKKIVAARLLRDDGRASTYVRWDAPAHDPGHIDTSKRRHKGKLAAASTAPTDEDPKHMRSDSPDASLVKLPRLDSAPGCSTTLDSAVSSEESEDDPDDDDDATNASVAVTMPNLGPSDESDNPSFDELLEQLQTAKRNAAELEATLRQTIDDLTVQVQVVQSKAVELETRVRGLERTNGNMKMAYQIKERILRAEHASEMESSRVAQASLADTNAFLRDRNESQRFVISNLNADRNKLNADKDKLNADKDRLNADKDRLNADKDRLNVDIRILNSKLVEALQELNRRRQ